jgi:surfactin synthase thioesterase subunit
LYQEALPSLGELVQLAPLELPGHGRRRGEALYYTIPEIIADLSSQARHVLGESGQSDYYIFGHSMGALCGFLLAKNLSEESFGPPKRLFVSSNGTPGWHPIPKGMTELPDLEMWKMSGERFGKLNNQPTPTEEQMELFSDIYRADLIAVQNFHRPEPIWVLSAPITAIYAESDMVDLELVSAWREWTNKALEIIKVKGEHFHALERPKQLEDILIARL